MSGRRLPSRAFELAAHQLGQGLGREEEALAGGTPIIAVGRDAARGDEAMDMRVVEELLRPGMKDGEDADGAADEAAIAGELNDRCGGGLEQHTVAVTLV